MPGARDNEIGRCACPICQSTDAVLRVSKKSLTYVVCPACKSQSFARGDAADSMLRGRHLRDPASAPAAAPPAPASAAPAPTPAAAPAPAPAAPAPRRSLLSW